MTPFELQRTQIPSQRVCAVSTVAQNGQTKHWLLRLIELFMFSVVSVGKNETRGIQLVEHPSLGATIFSTQDLIVYSHARLYLDTNKCQMLMLTC